VRQRLLPFLYGALGCACFLSCVTVLPWAMRWHDQVLADRAFAAWARNAVPTLAAEISRLQGLKRDTCS